MTIPKLAITGLTILLLTCTLSAAPFYITENSIPTPKGGIHVLSQKAEYPILAQQNRIESDVVLVFRIEADGRVSNLRIVHSGGKSFDESATKAVLGISWIPARQNGEAVAVTFEQPFEYRF
ncbi:energy transducer TonB [bacterium]|nr:energy transducer TonB [bacterium]